MQIRTSLALLSLTALTLLISCNNQSGKQKNESQQETQKNGYSQVVSNYLELKNDLVEGKGSAVQQKAKLSLEVIENEVLKPHFVQMASTDDIEKQRKAFEKLSKAMYVEVKENGLKGKILYKQYCPMAFNNEGAFWLSSEEEIMNPYFGDKMLHCGKVEEELK